MDARSIESFILILTWNFEWWRKYRDMPAFRVCTERVFHSYLVTTFQICIRRQLPARNFDRLIKKPCRFMKPWRRFSNELLACGYWWRFHRVLTAQWWARHGINLSGNPTLWPGPGWLIQGNIRGCILNTRPRAVEAHAWIRRSREGGREGRISKKGKIWDASERTVPSFLLAVRSFPFFPILFLFICNAVTPFREPIPFLSSRFIGQNSFIARR